MHLETMVYYLSGVVALEFVLRMLSGIFGLLRRSDAKEEPVPEPARPASAKVEQTRVNDQELGTGRSRNNQDL